MAQWLGRLLIDQGPLVGPTIHSVAGYCFGWAHGQYGDPVPREELIERVGRALAEQPSLRDAAAHPAYRSLVLQLFIEMHCAAGDEDGALARPAESVAHQARDEALRGAFESFRAALAQQGGWYAGTAPALALAHLRGRPPRAHHLGFRPDTQARWVSEWLRSIGSTPVAMPDRPLHSSHEPITSVCDGPEAELSAIARNLRERPRHCAVFVSAREVSRTATRLRDRDIPVRALLEHDATKTLAAKCFSALHHVMTAERLDRGRLREVLFGPMLEPFAASLAALPEAARPHPDQLDAVFRNVRRSTLTLNELPTQFERGVQRQLAELEAIAKSRSGPDATVDPDTRGRVANAGSVLREAIHALAALDTAGSVAGFLRDRGWGAQLRHAPLERLAASTVLDALNRTPDAGPGAAVRTVALALESARLETWLDVPSRRAAGAQSKQVPPAIWVMPYETLPLELVPESVVLANLDAHPADPRPTPMLSDPARAALGLPTQAQRHHASLQALDILASTSDCWASWRRRDGTGSTTPPGPWVVSRSEGALRVGLDGLAVARDDRPRSPNELGLLNPSDALKRRLDASMAQERDEPSPFTGELGVRVPPARPYSASSLARYADIPYRYFLERLLGVTESDDVSDALDPLEQGTLVHLGLERTYKDRLAQLGVVETVPEMLEEAKQHTRRAFAEQSDGLLAGAVWLGELERWIAELQGWWKTHEAKLARARGAEVQVFLINRMGDHELPAPQVIGAEVSLAGMQLELGSRSIPFTGSIDRVERDEQRLRLNIVDYKTGFALGNAALARHIRAGTHLQLPLYALALQQQLMKHPEISGGITRVGSVRLEFLKRGRRYMHAAASCDPWAPVGAGADGQILDAFRAAGGFVLSFVERMENGSFPLCRRGQPRRYPTRDEEVMRRLSSAAEAFALPLPLDPLPEGKP